VLIPFHELLGCALLLYVLIFFSLPAGWWMPTPPTWRFVVASQPSQYGSQEALISSSSSRSRKSEPLLPPPSLLSARFTLPVLTRFCVAEPVPQPVRW
jgi:hypothetical protein